MYFDHVVSVLLFASYLLRMPEAQGKLYILLMRRTLSRRRWRRGDKRVSDVYLGTPTLVINSAAHNQLSPLYLIRTWEPHGPHRNRMPTRLERPVTSIRS